MCQVVRLYLLVNFQNIGGKILGKKIAADIIMSYRPYILKFEICTERAGISKNI